MQAALKAGLPLLESISYALFLLPLSVDDKTYRTGWAKSKDDPTPKDSPIVKDNEFETRRGKDTTYYLTDNEKQELEIRQIHYVLSGGVLGSMIEVTDQDVIIIDLNIVFDEKQFDEVKAKETIKAQVNDAVNVYGAIEIKFNIVWTAGTGSVANLEITKGGKEGFINVFLTIGESGAVSQTAMTKPDRVTGEIKTYDIFLTREKFSIKGLSDNSMNTWALAHELGHKFGLVGYSGRDFLGFDTSNWSSDVAINTAILKAGTGSVVKGVDWNKSPYVRSILKDLTPTTFDLMRAGAKRLMRKS